MKYEEESWVRRAFTSFGSDVDLTAGADSAPKYPPFRLEVHNDETTTQDIVVRGGDGVNVTFEVPADSIRVIKGPSHTIESTGTQTIASVVAYWRREGVGR